MKHSYLVVCSIALLFSTAFASAETINITASGWGAYEGTGGFSISGDNGLWASSISGMEMSYGGGGCTVTDGICIGSISGDGYFARLDWCYQSFCNYYSGSAFFWYGGDVAGSASEVNGPYAVTGGGSMSLCDDSGTHCFLFDFSGAGYATAGVDSGGAPNFYSFYITGGSISGTATVINNYVPEPSSLLLFGSGMLGIMGSVARRFRSLR